MPVSAIQHLIMSETNLSTIAAMAANVLVTTSAHVPRAGEAGVARSLCVNQDAGTLANVLLLILANVLHTGLDQLAKKVFLQDSEPIN